MTNITIESLLREKEELQDRNRGLEAALYTVLSAARQKAMAPGSKWEVLLTNEQYAEIERLIGVAND